MFLRLFVFFSYIVQRSLISYRIFVGANKAAVIGKDLRTSFSRIKKSQKEFMIAVVPVWSSMLENQDQKLGNNGSDCGADRLD
jgi:hypothetical protein